MGSITTTLALLVLQYYLHCTEACLCSLLIADGKFTVSEVTREELVVMVCSVRRPPPAVRVVSTLWTSAGVV